MAQYSGSHHCRTGCAYPLCYEVFILTKIVSITDYFVILLCLLHTYLDISGNFCCCNKNWVNVNASNAPNFCNCNCFLLFGGCPICSTTGIRPPFRNIFFLTKGPSKSKLVSKSLLESQQPAAWTGSDFDSGRMQQSKDGSFALHGGGKF